MTGTSTSLKHRLSSIRIQLVLWFGGLTLVTLVSAGWYSGVVATRQSVASVGESLYITARSAAELLGNSLTERRREIELLRQDTLFVTGDLNSPQLRETLERYQSYSDEHAWIGITDHAGIVRQATSGLLVGADVSKRPWFDAGKQGVFLGDVHDAVLLAKQLQPRQDPSQPLRFIDIAAPVFNERNEFRGVLASHLYWSWVTQVAQTVVADRQINPDAELLIVDRKGAVIYPETFSEPLNVPANLTSRQRFQTLLWSDGRSYLSSAGELTALADFGWKLVMRQPLDSATAPARALALRLAALGALALLFFGVITYAISRRLSRPIEQLVRAAKEVETHFRPTSLPKDVVIREVNELVTTFEAMTAALAHREAQLRELNASLENQVADRTHELQQANKALEELSIRDSLTGVFNRRYVQERLNESHERFRRAGVGYAVLLLDVDNFKAINDTFGHPVGDAVLRALGTLLATHTRINDIVARYGGEEFMILVNAPCNRDNATALAEKLRHLVEKTQLPTAGKFTVSIGLCCVTDLQHAEQGDSVVLHADKALYQAKQNGKNQVVAWQEAPP